MQDDKILNKIIHTLASIINVEESSLTMDSDIKNTSEWDSFNHVMFVMKISELFSIDFSPDIILDFTSIRKIYNYIKGEKKC